MEGFSYVKCRSCCSSYFSFASASRIALPSFRLGSWSLATMVRWTSSIAPVLRGQLVSTLWVARLTTMTGQRSRAEMKAKDVLSEVVYGSAGASALDPMLASDLFRYHFDSPQALNCSRSSSLWSSVRTRSRSVSIGAGKFTLFTARAYL